MAECNSVRQALQELLTEYLSNAGKRPSEQLDAAIAQMCRKTRDLRRQLRKAVVDHVSDSFLEADGPLLLLVAAAQEGKEAEVEEFAGGETAKLKNVGARFYTMNFGLSA